MGLRHQVEGHAEILSGLMESVEELASMVGELKQQLKDDAFALVTLYEALKVLTAEPGNPHASAAATRDILGLLNTGE